MRKAWCGGNSRILAWCVPPEKSQSLAKLTATRLIAPRYRHCRQSTGMPTRTYARRRPEQTVLYRLMALQLAVSVGKIKGEKR